MRVISRKTLSVFWQKHASAKGPLQAWFAEAKAATWSSTMDIKRAYRSASFRPNNRVVFNIKGNDYRLVVKVNFPAKTVYIRFVGTHAEYDQSDVDTI